jgi:large subunit ribosomal protein L18
MRTPSKTEQRTRRQARIRAKVFGTAEKPRLAVHKSNTSIFAQLIDDEKGVTIAAINSRKVKGKSPADRAHATGMEIAKLAETKKIKKVVFDRGGFMYAGKIKAVAEGAREGGLQF